MVVAEERERVGERGEKARVREGPGEEVGLVRGDFEVERFGEAVESDFDGHAEALGTGEVAERGLELGRFADEAREVDAFREEPRELEHEEAGDW